MIYYVAVQERLLDPQAVEAAEFARKNGKVVWAAELAAMGLGLSNSPLTQEQVSELASDPTQRAVLATLARIYVSATKSIANDAMAPSQCITSLEQAVDMIRTVYNNDTFQRQIHDISEDHLGREHYFWAEMQRDVSKTITSTAILYDVHTATHLIELGEKTLQQTHDALDDQHPTKPLIALELWMSRIARGVWPTPDEFKEIQHAFHELKRKSQENNPHRVATVASWLIVWGEHQHNSEIARLGKETFIDIITKHPEWNFMIEKEEQKIAKAKSRATLFRFLAPVTVSRARRKALRQAINGMV